MSNEAGPAKGFPALQPDSGAPRSSSTAGANYATYWDNYKKQMHPREMVWFKNTRKTVLQYSSAGALIGLGVCGALTMRTNLSTLRRVILASSGGMLGALTGTAASTREWYPKLLALDDSSALARTARQAEERRRQKGAPEQTGIIGLGAAAAAGGTKDS